MNNHNVKVYIYGLIGRSWFSWISVTASSDSATDYLVASYIVATLMVCSTITFVSTRGTMGALQYVAALLHVIGFLELGEAQASSFNGSH